MTVKRRTMTAAEVIVEALKKEGIKHVFCVPGESYLPVLDALHDESSIQVISTRHEGGAAFMAEGYAKSTLKPGVVLATRGVGAANLSIGVHTAYQDSTPMIVLLGQVHSKFRGREGFQEIDLEQFFGPISKWAVEVRDPKRMPEMMDRAIRVSQSGRPGPVVISLPEDVLPIEKEMTFRGSFIRPKPAPSKYEVMNVERMLKRAKRPILIVGGGVKSSKAEAAIIDFAEKYHFPVLVAFRRHDAFPHHHPLFAGHLGLGKSKYIDQMIEEADTILALGTRLSEVTTKDYTLLKDHHTLIHVDIHDETIGKVYSPDIGIVADLSQALQAFSSIDIAPTWQEWVFQKRNAYQKASKLKLTETDIINKQVIATIQKILPNNALLTNDAGNFASWLHDFYQFTKPHTYVGPTSGAMGYGLPAAIGAKLAFPDKKVVTLAGDGGFMMTAQELETAVRYHIPVIALVFNNNMYGTIRMHQEMHYPEKVIGTDLGTVSFEKLAESVGAKGYTVKTIDEFDTAFTEALAGDCVSVIEIITEKEQISVTATIEEIRTKAKNKAVF